MDRTFDATSTFPESDQGAAPAPESPATLPHLATFPSAVVKALVGWTSEEPHRESLRLVRFESRRAIATDGKRLVVVEYGSDGKVPPLPPDSRAVAEVPRDALIAACRHAGPKGSIAIDPVRCELVATPAVKRGKDPEPAATIPWRRSEISFPPWRQVIPDSAWGPSPSTGALRECHRTAGTPIRCHFAAQHAVHPRLLAGIADVVDAVAGHLPMADQGVSLRGCDGPMDPIVYVYDEEKCAARVTFIVMPMVNETSLTPDQAAAQGKRSRK